MKDAKNVDNILLTLGFVLSYENIESVLGIILLSVQVAWILFRLIYTFVIYLRKAKETKELNFKELQAKYEESVKELEELKNGYKK